MPCVIDVIEHMWRWMPWFDRRCADNGMPVEGDRRRRTDAEKELDEAMAKLKKAVSEIEEIASGKPQ